MSESGRKSVRSRKTGETDITVSLSLDGAGISMIDTGVGFFDHMMTGLAKHGAMDLELTCVGDLQVDDHHTMEDCGLTVGAAIDEALLDRRGIARFCWAYVPMDEALARAVIHFSGRPYAQVNLALEGDRIGGCGCANLEHALSSLAVAARATLHVDVLCGRNDHHRAEAVFKAVAIAMRAAVMRDDEGRVPSTKGVL